MMKMKNKIIPVIVIVLVVILIGIWLYPSNESEKDGELTGTVVSSGEEGQETEPSTMQEDAEVDEIEGTALIGKCIKECGAKAANDLEQDIWKSMCNKKYQQGEDEIREFIKTC